MTTKECILTSLKSNKSKLEQSGVKHVGLFGSYVRDEQTHDSDFLLDFEPGKKNFDNYLQACNLLENLFKNEKNEIITKNGLSPYIGPAILKEVVYV